MPNPVESYPRDLIGYGNTPPHPNWPGGAKIAVQFVINYEEGGENTVLEGDAGAETFLSDIIGAPEVLGQRHMSMESLYEYGSRCGGWRLLNLFKNYNANVTIFAVARAMERNPQFIEQSMEAGHEICSHGLRWIDYQYVPREIEREHIQEAMEIHTRITGERPFGWYTGRTSPNTRELVVEEGGFIYDADDYSDDLPFWTQVSGKNHLVVPYTLDTNDMRFATAQGFNSSDQFFAYLKDAFDVLYAEGNTSPKMLSVGLHCRLAGRPARFRAVQRFLDYIHTKQDVWITRRVDIANHWRQCFPQESKA